MKSPTKQPEKKCDGLHCKCMNIGNQCPNNHWATCSTHNPNFPEKWCKCGHLESEHLLKEGCHGCPCLKGKCDHPSPHREVVICDTCQEVLPQMKSSALQKDQTVEHILSLIAADQPITLVLSPHVTGPMMLLPESRYSHLKK